MEAPPVPLPERKICSSHGRPLQTEGRFKPATGRLCKDRPESSERKRIPCSDSPMEIVSGSPGQPPWKAREIFNCFSETLQRRPPTDMKRPVLTGGPAETCQFRRFHQISRIGLPEGMVSSADGCSSRKISDLKERWRRMHRRYV